MAVSDSSVPLLAPEEPTPFGLILCGDCSGGHYDFVWMLLLLKVLRQAKQGVLLLSANHGREHYELVLRRHGLDVGKLEAQGLLELRILSFGPGESWNDVIAPCSINLMGKRCLFIDDLEALEAFAPSASAARVFISSMFACLGKGDLDSIAVFGRHVPVGFDAPGSPSLTEYCKHRAHVLVEIEPLSSGRSHDAQGLVTISYPLSKRGLEVAGAAERYSFKIAGAGSNVIFFSIRS